MAKRGIGFRRYRHAPRPVGFAATQNALAGYVQLDAPRVARARRDLNLSQVELALLIGVPPQDIARIEQGALFVTEPYAQQLSKKLASQLISARVALVPITYPVGIVA